LWALALDHTQQTPLASLSMQRRPSCVDHPRPSRRASTLLSPPLTPPYLTTSPFVSTADRAHRPNHSCYQSRTPSPPPQLSLRLSPYPPTWHLSTPPHHDRWIQVIFHTLLSPKSHSRNKLIALCVPWPQMAAWSLWPGRLRELCTLRCHWLTHGAACLSGALSILHIQRDPTL